MFPAAELGSAALKQTLFTPFLPNFVAQIIHLERRQLVLSNALSKS